MTDSAGPPGALTRTERDSLGPVEVPVERLWGAQTQRSLENFRIGGERMPAELIHALALIKRAVAHVNEELGELDAAKARAIAAACDEVLAGRHAAEFPLVIWQTGSGTQTNMNMNEVLANRASELLGGLRGAGRLVHPNDDVNRGQSSNDVFPTAMHVAAVLALRDRLIPAVRSLAEAFRHKAEAFADVVKLGRTHLQDATPLTLGQELSGYSALLERGLRHVEEALAHLSELALGGTAVGTGLNAHPELGARAAAELTRLTGHPFVTASNKFEALSGHEAIVFAHGGLTALATSMHKVADDVRWLASGPRAGLGELVLPANEPGSSIMPGKVNPTQSEAVIMVFARVLGNDVTVSFGGAAGHFELNTLKPVIAHAFLESVRLLADAADSFRTRCVQGLEPDRARIRQHVEASLMLVTALAPHVGYDAAARIAKHAQAKGVTLRQAALELGVVTAAQFDAWVRPETMTTPGGPA